MKDDQKDLWFKTISVKTAVRIFKLAQQKEVGMAVLMIDIVMSDCVPV
jgi:hypothetical protein